LKVFVDAATYDFGPAMGAMIAVMLTPAGRNRNFKVGSTDVAPCVSEAEIP
jgi:hypothetical protein